MSSPHKVYCPSPCQIQCCTDCGSPEKDIYLSQLKAEVFEKEQNERNYESLKAKLYQLQNELVKITKVKEQFEYDLCQTFEERNQLIADLRAKNENLLNELNEKIAMNKKLYNENNNLFRELEAKTAENQDLQDHMVEQKNVMDKFDTEKGMCEQKRVSLSQLNEKHMCDIQNLNDQVGAMCQKCEEQDGVIRARVIDINNLVKQLNDQKIINANLINELNCKEHDLQEASNHLAYAKDTLAHLNADFDNLTKMKQKGDVDISNMNSELLKENGVRQQFENSNQGLDEAICLKNQDIDKINCENEALQRDCNDLDVDNNGLSRMLNEYKKHVAILTDTNDKITKELEYLITRDDELRNTLERDNHLLQVQEENKNLIQDSLNGLQRYMDAYGNNGSPTTKKKFWGGNSIPKMNLNNSMDKSQSLGASQ